MPKNIGLGGKNKKKGKKFVETKRELEFKQEGEDYGQSIRLLGDCRIEILCSDGKKRSGHIKGSMRKKIFVNMGDIVLVSLNQYEDDKCDIVLKYTDDEIRKLKKSGEIPESFKLPGNDNKKEDGDDGMITFERAEEKGGDNIENRNNNRKDSISDDMDDEDEEEEDEEENEKVNKHNQKQKAKYKNEGEFEEEEKQDEEEEEEQEEEEEEEIVNTNKKNKNINNINANTGKFSCKKLNKSKRQNATDRKKEIADL